MLSPHLSFIWREYSSGSPAFVHPQLGAESLQLQAATLLGGIYIVPIPYFLCVLQIMQTLDKVEAYYYFAYPTSRISPVAQWAPAVNQVKLEKHEKFRDSMVADIWKHSLNTLVPSVATSEVPKRPALF